jgi:Zn-dependent protease
MSFKATTWVENLGFLASFSIYAAVLAFFSLLLPIFYFYGKQMRRWTSGTVASPGT